MILRVRIFLASIVLCLLLQGCIGAAIVSDRVSVSEEQFVFKNRDDYLRLKGAPDERDVSENLEVWKYYQDESAWCGLFIYAVIIPIPLALPTCEKSETATFNQEGVTVKVEVRDTEWKGAYCAPIAPVLDSAFGHHSKSAPVCQSK